jgi:lipid II:glycine glycyltransferase (peptidoglycan interpeptide bridge formation enzyme)
MAYDPNGSVSAHLFMARLHGDAAGAALILKTAQSIHYLFGGTDRRFSKLRVGEYLHWSIIEWGIAAKAKLYDLEGINPLGNPGTYAFKKKFGGREVVLPGKEYRAAGALGYLIATVDRLRDRTY